MGEIVEFRWNNREVFCRLNFIRISILALDTRLIFLLDQHFHKTSRDRGRSHGTLDVNLWGSGTFIINNRPTPRSKNAHQHKHT